MQGRVVGRLGGRLGGRWLHAMRPYDEQLELAPSAGMSLQPSGSQRNKGKQNEFTAEGGGSRW